MWISVICGFIFSSFGKEFSVAKNVLEHDELRRLLESARVYELVPRGL